MYQLLQVRRSLRIYNRVRDKEKFLPDELVFGILVRLPVKSVGRCKCVCKLWCSLIQDPKFINKHLARSKVVYEYGKNTNVNEDEETFEYVRGQDGVLVEKGNLTGKFRIRNPTTKNVLDLPDLHGKDIHVWLFRLRETNTIKLVNVYTKEGTEHGGCQVLTVATHLTWRTVDCPCFHNLGAKGESFFSMSIGEVFFVTRFFDDVGLGVSEVVCFEMESEHFATAKIPRAFFPSFEHVEPFSWEQKLSLANLEDQVLHVWVLEDYKEEKWTEMKIAIPSELFGEYPKNLRTLSPYSFANNWLWFWRCDDSRVKYNIQTDRKRISRPPAKGYLYKYFPSLVSWEVNRPQEKLKRKRNKKSSKARQRRKTIA